MKFLKTDWLPLKSDTYNSNNIDIANTDINIGKKADKTIVHSDFLESPRNETGVIYLTYEPHGYWLNRMDSGEVSIDFPGAAHMQQTGAPKLVQEGLLVAIPCGAQILSVETTAVEKELCPEEVQILPVPIPAKNNEPYIAEPDPFIYNTDSFYPAAHIVRLGEKEFMGVYCTHLLLCPMEYNPHSRKLNLFKSVTIKITYRNTSLQANSEKKGVFGCFRGNPAMRDFILGCPAQSKYDESPRMVIITSKIFKGNMTAYRRAKSGEYQIDDEITVEDIHSKYPQFEKQAAIRTYLMKEHAKNPIHTVILAGNTAEVPSYSGYGCMSDSYYAQTAEDNYAPLFSISRFPAATATELREMTEYASVYNNNKQNLRNNAIFIAYNDSDFTICSDEIISNIDSRFHPIKRYDGDYGHIDVIRSINAGSGFINYRGHGSCSNWSTANAPLLSEIPRLKTGGNAPHVFSIACLTNSIETDTCYGSVWLRNLKAASFLGASRSSWRNTNNTLDKSLWRLINEKKYKTIGEIYQAASNELAINSPNRYAVENLQSYLLLGDATAEFGA